MLTANTKSTTVSREYLRTVPVAERGERSEVWQGVQHGELADLVVSGMESAGLTLEREQWLLSHENQRMYGTLTLLDHPTVSFPPGLRPCFSLRHGNDSSMRIWGAASAIVQVCANGMKAHQEFPLIGRKHTTNVLSGLRDLVRKGIERFIELSAGLPQSVEQLEALRLSDDEAYAFCVRAARKGVVSFADIGKIIEEWHTSSFSAFEPRNAWSLYNAFTQVAKEKSPTLQTRIIGGAYEVLLPARAA